jgi:hypothetical protein
MALAQDIALVDQLGEDLVGTALCDADRIRDVSQANPGVVGDAEQNMGVVGEEIPASGCRLCGLTGRHGLTV